MKYSEIKFPGKTHIKEKKKKVCEDTEQSLRYDPKIKEMESGVLNSL